MSNTSTHPKCCWWSHGSKMQMRSSEPKKEKKTKIKLSNVYNLFTNFNLGLTLKYTHTHTDTCAQSQSHSGKGNIIQVIYKMHTQNKCQQSPMPNKAQQAASMTKTMSEHSYLAHTQIQIRYVYRYKYRYTSIQAHIDRHAHEPLQ